LLLKDNRASEAAPWLKKLIAADPDGFATLSLQARSLLAEGNTDQVQPLAEEYLQQRLEQAKSPADRSKLLLSVGNLYSQLHMDRAAERTIRSAMTENAADYASLATWLAGHEKLPEAIELCLGAVAHDETPQAATLLTRLLVLGHADKETARRVEPLLQKALRQHGEQVEFLFTLATWRLVADQNEEAVMLLRKVLAAEPRHLMALNNLATALGEQPATDAEACELIGRAIAQAGPLVELLDTKGTLLLAAGDVDGAVKVLRDATSRSSSDPRHFFHLALALRRAGKLPESRVALERAHKLSIDAAVLTPKNQRLLSELEQDLKN
jgi:tetratricopeptide (TPR) repeat protein